MDSRTGKLLGLALVITSLVGAGLLLASNPSPNEYVEDRVADACADEGREWTGNYCAAGNEQLQEDLADTPYGRCVQVVVDALDPVLQDPYNTAQTSDINLDLVETYGEDSVEEAVWRYARDRSLGVAAQSGYLAAIDVAMPAIEEGCSRAYP